MRLNVKFLDGTSYEATIIPGDNVRLERHYKISAAALEDEMKFEHLLFLAFTSLKRVGQATTDDFEVFLDLVEDIDVVTEGGAPLAQPQPSNG